MYKSSILYNIAPMNQCTNAPMDQSIIIPIYYCTNAQTHQGIKKGTAWGLNFMAVKKAKKILLKHN